MITTLAHLNHHVCTAFGDSENSQGIDTWQKAVAGIGQGNGAGPHIWAAVSMPLFDIMQTNGFVAKFICTLSQQHKELAGFAFIDDTDLIVNDDQNTTDAVINKMQKSLSMWHGLLWATRGKLVPEKCFWYLIDFKWENNKWAYKKTGEAPGQIRVMINQEEQITIPRLEPSEAHRTLGIQLAPDGNDLEETKHLWDVTAEWS